MQQEVLTEPVNFDDHLHRSIGRKSRAFVASAKVTRAEQAELETAARMLGLSLSEWARAVLLRAARGASHDPAFTEIIAMRLLLNTILKRIACGELMTAESFNHEIQRIRNDKQKVAKEVMQTYHNTENSNGK